jgi:formate/nitrite transporter FocA (FNT family)
VPEVFEGLHVISKSAKHEEREAKRPGREILRQELQEALASMEGSTRMLCLSGVSAGLDIGFSPLLVAAMRTQAAGQLPGVAIELLAANMYAVGFVFVVLGRTELFTEQTSLAVLPVLNGDISVALLARQWVVIFLSNLVGGAAFAAIAVSVMPNLGVIEPKVLGEIARDHLDHSGLTMLVSGVLAGWLMGLLSWLVAAGRETISQIVIVWLVAGAIGFAHLHHVIVGGVQLMMAALAGQDVSAADFGRFLLFVTLGNIVGGSFFVALIKFGQTAWANADTPAASKS